MTTPPPIELGYRMPAEWEPHAATWIAWPHQRSDWPGRFVPIPWVYVEIVRHLHQSEPVHIVVSDTQMRQRVTRQLGRAGVDLKQVAFHEFLTDRVWTRDSGPIFITRESEGGRQVAATHWLFNAWAKYPDWQNDARLPERVAEALGMYRIEPTLNQRRLVLEGGSIDVNGLGCLLTTEECLLSDVQQRNPGLTREDYESVFADYLGAVKVLWLGNGIAGDDTHGHVDDLARFVGPRTVVAVVEDDTSDPNYGPLQDNLERLRGMTDVAGRPLEIVPLPMPKPLWFASQRLPASYANFYIANRHVLVPTFNDPNDRRALGILAELFPDRTVVGIHAVELVWGFGTLHCLTQQQPAGEPGLTLIPGI